MRPIVWISSVCVVLVLCCGGCETNRAEQAKKVGTAEVATQPSSAVTKTPATDAAAAHYEVVVQGASVQVGQPGQLSVKIVPKAGFKVNKEFPWQAVVGTTEGVELPKEPLGSDKWKLGEQDATLGFPVKVDTAGDKQVVAKLNFSVCNDDRCDVIRDKEVAWKVATK